MIPTLSELFGVMGFELPSDSRNLYEINLHNYYGKKYYGIPYILPPASIIESAIKGELVICFMFHAEGIANDRLLLALHTWCEKLNIPTSSVCYFSSCVNFDYLYKSFCERHAVSGLSHVYVPSFFILKKEQGIVTTKPVTKKFINLSRKIRTHRYIFQILLFYRGLNECFYLSQPTTKEPLHLSDIEQTFSKYGFIVDSAMRLAIADWQKALPLLVDWDKNTDINDTMLTLGTTLLPYFETSLFHVVGETLFKDNEIFITEKSLKPFYYFQLPLWVAAAGTVAALRTCGFDVFDDIIDHSYDSIEDNASRLIAVVNEVSRLNDKFSLDQCSMLRTSIRDRLALNSELSINWFEKNKLEQQQLFHNQLLKILRKNNERT